MRTVFLLFAITAAMLAAVACARKSENDGRSAEATLTGAALANGSAHAKASCDTSASLGTCDEYVGGRTFGLERSICDGYKGRFAVGAAAACPAERRIARCEIGSGVVKRYYDSLTLTDAKADCESQLVHGTFAVE